HPTSGDVLGHRCGGDRARSGTGSSGRRLLPDRTRPPARRRRGRHLAQRHYLRSRRFHPHQGRRPADLLRPSGRYRQVFCPLRPLMPYAGKLATPRSLPRTLAFVIGAAVTAVGMMMMVPTVIAFVLAEHDAALGLGASAAIAIGCGVLGWRTLGRPGPIGMKEGFATVGLAWFVLSAFCALPYLFSGTIPGITDAFFESASGLTTTGASVISNPSNLPRGIGIWRGITQWLGGMGVIVLSIAVLPLLGTGGVQLARAETPGGAPDRLTPRFQDTAKRLWLFYVALTGVVA